MYSGFSKGRSISTFSSAGCSSIDRKSCWVTSFLNLSSFSWTISSTGLPLACPQRLFVVFISVRPRTAAKRVCHSLTSWSADFPRSSFGTISTLIRNLFSSIARPHRLLAIRVLKPITSSPIYGTIIFSTCLVNRAVSYRSAPGAAEPVILISLVSSRGNITNFIFV